MMFFSSKVGQGGLQPPCIGWKSKKNYRYRSSRKNGPRVNGGEEEPTSSSSTRGESLSRWTAEFPPEFVRFTQLYSLFRFSLFFHQDTWCLSELDRQPFPGEARPPPRFPRCRGKSSKQTRELESVAELNRVSKLKLRRVDAERWVDLVETEILG